MTMSPPAVLLTGGVVSGPLPVMYYVVAALVLAPLVAWITLRAERAVRGAMARRRVGAAWAQFSELLDRRGADDDQQRLLSALARLECPQQPQDILRHRFKFERAVQNYIEGLDVSDGVSGDGWTEDTLHALRQMLEFDASADAVIYSTREIAAGAPMRLSVVRDDGSVQHFSAVLHREREWVLELQIDQRPGDDLRGAVVQAAFYPGKKAFGFTSTIKDVDAETQRLYVEHTLAVPSIDQRRFERVEVSAALHVTVKEGAEERILRMDMHDLSAGGAALRCPECIENPDEVLLALSVQPAGLLPSNALIFRGLQKEHRLLCRIICQRRMDDHCMMHCEFVGLSSEEMNELEKVVQLIKRSRDGE